jgi:hypothetical protein
VAELAEDGRVRLLFKKQKFMKAKMKRVKRWKQYLAEAATKKNFTPDLLRQLALMHFKVIVSSR